MDTDKTQIRKRRLTGGNRGNEARREFRDPFQSAAVRVFLDDEAQGAVAALDAEVEKKGQQPVAGEVVVVEWQDALDASGVVGAGGEIGAEEQIIGRAQETGEAREDEL